MQFYFKMPLGDRGIAIGCFVMFGEVGACEERVQIQMGDMLLWLRTGAVDFKDGAKARRDTPSMPLVVPKVWTR